MASASEVVEGLVSRGIPRVAAIGIAGNYYAESGFDTGINEINPTVKGSRGGFGLAQWTGPRRRQFESFAKAQGRGLSDLDTQLDFTAWELANTEKGAAKKIYAASTPEEAARATSKYFLRPGIERMGHRVKAAQQIGAGEELTGGGVTPSVGGGAGDDTLSGYTPDQNAALYEAYLSGQMNASERQAYLGAMQSGRASVPQGVEVQRKYTPENEQTLLEAYNSGAMNDDEKGAYDIGVQLGQISKPVSYAPIQSDEGLMLPPRADERTQAQPAPVETDFLGRPKDRKFDFDLTREMASESGGAMVGPALRGEAVDLPSSLGLAEKPLEAVANVGMAGLGAMGAVVGGAAGLAGDVLQYETGSESLGESVATELAAIPEAFAGSPTSNVSAVSRGARPAPVVAAKTAPVQAAASVATESMTPEQLGGLIRNAASGGIGSKKAAQKLALEARVNPEAMAAANRIGMDLPMDIVADHTQLKEAIGLTRSLYGSEASADFRDAVAQAVTRADEVMDSMDASPDLSSISDKVLRSLQSSTDDLAEKAKAIYDSIDESVPKNTQFQPNNVVKSLNAAIEDLGGVDGLSKSERSLFNMVTGDQPVTYERMMREKRQIGKAVGGLKSPYDDADTALLKRLYGAISDDQVENIARIGGDDLSNSLKVANGLHAKKKALEDSIVGAYGKDVNGSLANKLRLSITQASKGDVANLNKVLEVIPEDLRGEAIATAISTVSRSMRSEEGRRFGFSEFTKMYQGLRQNGAAYKKIEAAIGPERAATLRDMYEVSKRVTSAEAQVLKTGKANQAILQSMTAEGLVAKVLHNSIAGRATKGAIITAANRATPFGGTAADMLSSGKNANKRISAAGDLFKSDEFQSLVRQAATREKVSSRSIRVLSNSPKFRKWAARSGIDNPQAWIAASLADNNFEEKEQ